MIEIKDLLERFKHTLFSEEEKKESVRKIISRAINTEIKKEEITIKNGTVYLNIRPIHKSEIFLKREKIARQLEEVLGRDADIR